MYNFLRTENLKYTRYYMEKQTISSRQKGRFFSLLPGLFRAFRVCTDDGSWLSEHFIIITLSVGPRKSLI